MNWLQSLSADLSAIGMLKVIWRLAFVIKGREKKIEFYQKELCITTCNIHAYHLQLGLKKANKKEGVSLLQKS
jgi:hypothetical protein